MDKKKLLVRAVSGLVYVAVITVACIYGMPGLMALSGLLAIIATIEFQNMCKDPNPEIFPTRFFDVTLCFLVACGFIITSLYLWVTIVLVRVVAELYIKQRYPLRNLATSFMPQIYIGLPLMMMTYIPDVFTKYGIKSGYVSYFPSFGVTYDWTLVLIMFFMIWINDTGAFLVGSLCGRHKLFERLSPKKTWEGFFGGLIFNLVAATLFCYFGGKFVIFNGNLFFWLPFGLIVTLFATWGDLLESLIKRDLCLKDSGNLIPGHGGILDRIDSLLLVAPAIYCYCTVYCMYFVWG